MIEIIPNWHPIFVHFTITLLVFAGLFQFLIWFFRSRIDEEKIKFVQKWLIGLGSVFVIITVATGLQAYYTVDHDTASHHAMQEHRNWAVLTAAVFLIAAGLFYFLTNYRQILTGSLLVVSFVLVTITAYKGGELVYVYGLGVRSLPSVDSDDHRHSHTESEQSDLEPDKSTQKSDDSGQNHGPTQSRTDQDDDHDHNH